MAVCTIRQDLAAAYSLKPKHAIKQVDRLLSNPAINVDDILVRWVPFVIGARDTIVATMDWTEFNADKQATIMLAPITDNGRSTPLVWLTVDKNTLKDHCALYEHRVLMSIACWCGLLNWCQQRSMYVSLPIAASVLKSFTRC